jgi:cytochrome oxidase assembly protein ShyY1
MQQSSHLASSFSSIAESFKSDTQEVFEGKAKAIAIHIGITSDPAYIMCLISYWQVHRWKEWSTLSCERMEKHVWRRPLLLELPPRM